MFRILPLAAFLLFSTNNARAQVANQFSAEISVNAHVVQAIDLITVNSMQFGSTQPGQKLIYVNPISSLNAAFMIAIGTPRAEFRITYLPEMELINTEGNGSLIFRYEISANEQETQSTSALLDNENRNLQFNEEGRMYIWVGGSVNLENAQPGSYEGDFTIEIDYI